MHAIRFAHLSSTQASPAMGRAVWLTRGSPQHRKQQLNSQTSELEALEARIREMEQRLKGQPGLAGLVSNGRPNGSPRSQRPPVANAFSDADAPPPPPEKDNQRPPSGGQSRDQSYNKYGGRRPGTARESQQAVPGALPPTPVGSEGECEPVPSPRAAPRSPAQTRLRGSGNLPLSSSSSSTSSYARVKVLNGSDSPSAQSMSDSVTFADYVVVSRSDGDGEKDV